MRIIYFIILTLFFSLKTWATELPDLGDPADTVFTLSQQRELISGFKKLILSAPELNRDLLINDYLQTLGHKLDIKHGQNAPKIHFFLVNNTELNAFSGPGGFIVLHSGLFKHLRNENELAAVISHEMAHVYQRHFLQQISHMKQLEIPLLINGLASIALGTLHPALGEGAMVAGMAGLEQNMLNFTRLHEREADRIGILLLKKAGFDPLSMAEVFKRFYEQERLSIDHEVPPFFRTHPVSEERITDAYNHAETYEKKKSTPNMKYLLIKARLDVFSRANLHDSYKKYQEILHNNPNDIAHQYAYALLLMKLNQFQEAENILKKLIKQFPDEFIFPFSLGEMYIENHQYPQGVKIYEKLFIEHPHHHALIIAYGKALLAAEEYQKAFYLLQQSSFDFPHDPIIFRLLARSEAKQGENARAYFSIANALALEGKPRSAIQQLKIADQMTKDKYLKAQIKAKIDLLLGKSVKPRDMFSQN